MGRRIITPEAMLSYPHLFTPQQPQWQGGKPMFSAAFVFAPGADLTPLKAAALEAAQEKWGAKAGDMIKKRALRMPFRDDAEAKGYEEGSVYINARSDRQPGVVSIFPDPESGKPMPITNPDEVYPGAVVRASVTAFAYDRSGNKGVSFALNNIQKLRDGERLDGRVKAADEFDADQNAVADLSDLESGSDGDEGVSLDDLLG